MGAEQQARQQLVGAIAQAVGELVVEIDDEEERIAEIALTIVETLRTPCTNPHCCHGELRALWPDALGKQMLQVSNGTRCPDCSGTGLGMLAIDAARGLHFSHGLYSFPSARPTETKP